MLPMKCTLVGVYPRRDLKLTVYSLHYLVRILRMGSRNANVKPASAVVYPVPGKAKIRIRIQRQDPGSWIRLLMIARNSR